ncbi:hypothetical protein JCM19301_657 [Jejuia pallidilutea]|uniref:Uncharacterized protein n=1 Tax=Jejuia pallidilutea TaxID=504487 RepID=A0A090W502_9FLAO|nr:hypothetical protein JCM19301_657 [Jejuia pallidilutea]GAL70509.1 hypothetical protein JCM19302_1418 [Jejuia pallidilutea]GAL88127.1 hypothetical protein JCM19538_2490 [Jejuia pallidilutea]
MRLELWEGKTMNVKRDPQGNAQLKTLFYKNYLKTLKNERFSLKCERF